MMRDLEVMHAMASKHEVTSQELMDWRARSATFMYRYVSCGFKVYPKFHYLQHIPEQVEQSGVVRSFWVHAEESKNRELKTLFNVCSKGVSLHQQILLRLQWLFALS